MCLLRTENPLSSGKVCTAFKVLQRRVRCRIALQGFTGPSPVSEARMNVHISYKVPKTPEIEKEIQHRTGKIQKRLQVFKPELVHLKGSVEENSPREATTVSLNFRLPSAQIAPQQPAPSPPHSP